MYKGIEVIGIDHGWSYMKTISHVFVTGVEEIATEPAFTKNLLEFGGKFYKIGGTRLEVQDVKTKNDNFFLLTLAAIAKELKSRGKREAKIYLAVGLPLTRFGQERADFIRYLTARRNVKYQFEKEEYRIEVLNAFVFPQCYAAVADKLSTYKRKVLVVDIGSWTVDMMPVVDEEPDEPRCSMLQRGLNGDYTRIIENEVRTFMGQIYHSIREHGYNLQTTPLIFVGGGAVVMKNYGPIQQGNVTYNLDIKANARGYEYLTYTALRQIRSRHEFINDSENDAQTQYGRAEAGRTAAIHHGRGTGADKKGAAWGTAGRDEE